MPIYEFKCGKCGKRFETLCRSSADEDVSCPACHGRKVNRLMSSFFSGGSGKSDGGSAGSCAGCSSKKCSTCR